MPPGNWGSRCWSSGASFSSAWALGSVWSGLGPLNSLAPQKSIIHCDIHHFVFNLFYFSFLFFLCCWKYLFYLFILINYNNIIILPQFLKNLVSLFFDSLNDLNFKKRPYLIKHLTLGHNYSPCHLTATVLLLNPNLQATKILSTIAGITQLANIEKWG